MKALGGGGTGIASGFYFAMDITFPYPCNPVQSHNRLPVTHHRQFQLGRYFNASVARLYLTRSEHSPFYPCSLNATIGRSIGLRTPAELTFPKGDRLLTRCALYVADIVVHNQCTGTNGQTGKLSKSRHTGSRQ